MDSRLLSHDRRRRTPRSPRRRACDRSARPPRRCSEAMASRDGPAARRPAARANRWPLPAPRGGSPPPARPEDRLSDEPGTPATRVRLCRSSAHRRRPERADRRPRCSRSASTSRAERPRCLLPPQGRITRAPASRTLPRPQAPHHAPAAPTQQPRGRTAAAPSRTGNCARARLHALEAFVAAPPRPARPPTPPTESSQALPAPQSTATNRGPRSRPPRSHGERWPRPHARASPGLRRLAPRGRS